ncbi:MAG: hypothetical protein BJ554DRAFT_1965, partial [Olpidium bornovanus]
LRPGVSFAGGLPGRDAGDAAEAARGEGGSGRESRRREQVPDFQPARGTQEQRRRRVQAGALEAHPPAAGVLSCGCRGRRRRRSGGVPAAAGAAAPRATNGTRFGLSAAGRAGRYRRGVRGYRRRVRRGGRRASRPRRHAGRRAVRLRFLREEGRPPAAARLRRRGAGEARAPGQEERAAAEHARDLGERGPVRVEDPAGVRPRRNQGPLRRAARPPGAPAHGLHQAFLPARRRRARARRRRSRGRRAQRPFSGEEAEPRRRGARPFQAAAATAAAAAAAAAGERPARAAVARSAESLPVAPANLPAESPGRPLARGRAAAPDRRPPAGADPPGPFRARAGPRRPRVADAGRPPPSPPRAARDETLAEGRARVVRTVFPGFLPRRRRPGTSGIAGAGRVRAGFRRAGRSDDRRRRRGGPGAREEADGRRAVLRERPARDVPAADAPQLVRRGDPDQAVEFREDGSNGSGAARRAQPKVFRRQRGARSRRARRGKFLRRRRRVRRRVLWIGVRLRRRLGLRLYHADPIQPSPAHEARIPGRVPAVFPARPFIPRPIFFFLTR